MKEKIYKERKVKNSMIIPGDPSGSPDGLLKVVVFIDNAYLLRLRNYFFKTGLRYSVKNLVNNLALKNSYIVEKIFFYDAPPFQSPFPSNEERKRKESYDKFISYLRKDGIEIREGRTQRLKVGDEFVFKQKGVDMLLGIDMVGIEKEFPAVKNIVLISGDSDFVPVVKKLKKQNIDVILWTYFERKRTSPFSKSNKLIDSVGRYIKITKDDFENARLK
ncbi:MAG: NYN domain-containing protein [Nanoarchaeota archaeon]